MIGHIMHELCHKPGVGIHAGASLHELAGLLARQNLRLPPAHEELLTISNGLEAYWGYFRLFGFSATGCIDAIEWNSRESWKFAWGNRCAEFWCFGETAWGDQYAYSSDGMKRGKPHVYLLDALSMSPEVVAESFEELLDREFLRCAELPYDEMIIRARHKLGPIETDFHLVYSPSPLIGGVEDIDSVQKMNARLAMICNGDIAGQLDDAPGGSELVRVETYEDENGRVRFRLIWS